VALKAAEKWCGLASDANRRAAQTAAEEATLATPAGGAALAAFLSEGSLGPPNVQAVPPADHLTARLVATTLAVAAGTNRWPDAPPARR